MKRTQILLDEETYEKVRQLAFDKKVSIAFLIREAIKNFLKRSSK